MSRVPGTYRHAGRTLYLLPSIPDDSPVEIKNGLAIRNACAIQGRCPACGTVPDLTLDQHGIWHLTFRHDYDCPCLRNGEAA